MGWIMSKHFFVFISYGFFIGFQNHFLRNLSFLTVLQFCLFHKTSVYVCMGLLDTLLPPLVDLSILTLILGFLRGSVVRNPPATQETQVWSLGWEEPLERTWQPTPVFLPGKSQGQRSLEGYSPWCCKELDMTEWLNTQCMQPFMLVAHFALFRFVYYIFCKVWTSLFDEDIFIYKGK